MSKNDYNLWQNHRSDDQIDNQLIYRDPSRGDVVSRVGGIASIYFLNGWQKQVRLAIRDLVEDYIDFFEKEITHCHRKNSRQLQKFDRKKFLNYLDKEIHKGEEEELYCALHHADLKNEDDPGLWQFMASGFSKKRYRSKIIGSKDPYSCELLFKKSG